MIHSDLDVVDDEKLQKDISLDLFIYFTLFSSACFHIKQSFSLTLCYEKRENGPICWVDDLLNSLLLLLPLFS
jgi:hypothetical protein